MKYNVYAIRDAVGKIYTAPYLQTNNGMAVRDLQDRLQRDKESKFRKHSKDFTLCHIGEYDDEEAKMIPEMPSIVAHVADLILADENVAN